jgi:hypothetical protein
MPKRSAIEIRRTIRDRRPRHGRRETLPSMATNRRPRVPGISPRATLMGSTFVKRYSSGAAAPGEHSLHACTDPSRKESVAALDTTI